MNRFTRHIQRIKEFIRDNGGDFQIQVYRVPNVVNAKEEGVKEHEIQDLYLYETQDGNVVPRATGATFETDEIAFDVPDTGLMHTGFRPNEHWYAKRARGFVIARVKTFEGTFVGRAICSAQDKFNGNIGVVIALTDALNRAAKKGAAIGNEWRQFVARNRQAA